ncbi:MAG: response regulator [Proteobacteria bacterium]|nr:response regulator [Pseudomonadota bacterium]
MATVLIVEDEESLRTTLARSLDRRGHGVIPVADGREAFDRGLSAEPDVLIADWMLKNHLHGLHVSEALRAVYPELRTILITGFPSRDLRVESARCGVVSLLEKPFDLDALHEAVDAAVGGVEASPARSRPIAVVEVERDGSVRFASERAEELFASVGAPEGDQRLAAVLDVALDDLLEAALGEWVPVEPKQGHGARWLVRSRMRDGGRGWLVVLCPEAEQARRTEPTVRILLEHRSRSQPLVADGGPVVVIERDGAVRRLLVSQFERIGSICYPADDLEAALKLLRAEPRVRTILLDFALAGPRVVEWVEQIKKSQPLATVIGTGGAGSEEELLASGVTRVLAKPWRIMDLVDVLTATD